MNAQISAIPHDPKHSQLQNADSSMQERPKRKTCAPTPQPASTSTTINRIVPLLPTACGFQLKTLVRGHTRQRDKARVLRGMLLVAVAALSRAPNESLLPTARPPIHRVGYTKEYALDQHTTGTDLGDLGSENLESKRRQGAA